ncbi:MAG: flagellar basal-body MS-ring/collar protein FliF [Steroidobacteraceae bacterium]
MNAAVTTVYPRWAAGLKPLLLLVGIAAAVAAGVSVVLWSRGPSYSLLYANLGTEDQAQVTQALDAAGIPYQLTPGGNAIEVPSERVNDARLKLAGQGLPEGDGGFAMLSKDPGLGVSQFIENARYQHALEVELAHTIASLRPIDGARVHIAASADSAFVRDRRAASASVFVQLKPGRVLSQEQVQAIVNLVASSVPNLDAGQVTVVDQQGRLLSAPQGTDDLALRDARFEVVRQIEDDYAQRIQALLAPLVGAGRVRAQVVADLDTAVTEEAREQYQPGSQIVRSEQQSEQTTRDGSAAGGVPGALSNQPPPAGVAQPPPVQRAASANGTGAAAASGAAAGAAGAAGGSRRPGATPPAVDATAAQSSPESVSKQSTRNYEIDRTLAYTRQPAGNIKRLTVAVLLDNVRTVDKDGKPHERPLSQAELDHITQLVKDAVGFDAKRGDSVNVFNSSFQSDPQPADAPLERVPLWERPLVAELAKLAAGLIVLLVLVLAVLRPLVRTLIGPARAVLNASAARAAVDAPSGPSGGAAAPAAAAQPAPQRVEQQLTNARALVNQDPKRVAQVVRTWVAADE